ncbi:hypothetical protein HDU92_006975, partial [Lobulomyces angularis]
NHKFSNKDSATSIEATKSDENLGFVQATTSTMGRDRDNSSNSQEEPDTKEQISNSCIPPEESIPESLFEEAIRFNIKRKNSKKSYLKFYKKFKTFFKNILKKKNSVNDINLDFNPVYMQNLVNEFAY